MVEASRYPIYAYGDIAARERPPARAARLGRLRLPAFPRHPQHSQPRAAAPHRAPRLERRADVSGACCMVFASGGAAVVNRIMPEPAAALTNGMVLGIEGGISDEVNDAFKATGTSHLIVISGSNIAFLAGALAVALGRVLPRRRAAMAAAPFVLVYVLLVGADPPALRAGVIGLARARRRVLRPPRNRVRLALRRRAGHAGAQSSDALGHRVSTELHDQPGPDPLQPASRRCAPLGAAPAPAHRPWRSA